MTIIASIHGRTGGDPVARTTKSGADMTTCSVAVDVAGKGAEQETLWVSLLAFGATAEALLRAEKGQMISAIGRLSRGSYTGKDGTEREQWTLLADAVVTAKSARPGGRKQAATRRQPDGASPFDDPLSF